MKCITKYIIISNIILYMKCNTKCIFVIITVYYLLLFICKTETKT